MINLRIKELREEKGLSQKQLAEAIGLNHRTISHYENGRLEPNLETIEKLSKFFGVTVGYLLGIEEFY